MIFLNFLYLFYFQIALKRKLHFFKYLLWITLTIEIVALALMSSINLNTWNEVVDIGNFSNLLVLNLMFWHFAMRLFPLIFGFPAIKDLWTSIKKIRKTGVLLPFNLYKTISEDKEPSDFSIIN